MQQIKMPRRPSHNVNDERPDERHARGYGQVDPRWPAGPSGLPVSPAACCASEAR